MAVRTNFVFCSSIALTLFISKYQVNHSFAASVQVDANFDEDSLEHEGDGHWPFSSFVEQLILDMFDPGELYCYFVLGYTLFFFYLFLFE